MQCHLCKAFQEDHGSALFQFVGLLMHAIASTSIKSIFEIFLMNYLNYYLKPSFAFDNQKTISLSQRFHTIW